MTIFSHQLSLNNLPEYNKENLRKAEKLLSHGRLERFLVLLALTEKLH